MADLIEVLSPKALEDLTAANQLVLELIKNIDRAGKRQLGGNTPSSYAATIKDLNDKLAQ